MTRGVFASFSHPSYLEQYQRSKAHLARISYSNSTVGVLKVAQLFIDSGGDERERERDELVFVDVLEYVYASV